MAREGTRRGARGPAISLTVTPATVQLSPGDRAEVRLAVEATDPNAPPTRYHLDVTGLQRPWYTLGETDILLGPDARATVSLVLHPAPGKASPGRYPFRVRATWPANPSIGASAVVTLTVAAAAEPGDAALGPHMSAAAPLAQPAQPSTRPTAMIAEQPAGRPVDAPPERQPAAVPWTAAAGPARRRRIPLAVGLGVLLILLLGEGVVLASRLSAPSPASNRAAAPAVIPTTSNRTVAPASTRAAAPAATPTAPILPAGAVPGRTPYGIVAGAGAPAPVIRRFAVIRGSPGRPATLVWQTAHAAVVTIDGHAAPPGGTRAIQPSIYGSTYSLRARAGGRVATAHVRAVAVNPIVVAATVPVALVNVTALRFPASAAGARGATRTVRVVNLGPGALVIARTSLDGDRRDFAIHDSCAGHTLPVDASCTIDVRFTPTRRGARHASLTLADNTAVGSHRVLLDGVGL